MGSSLPTILKSILYCTTQTFNLSNDTILDWSQFKAYAYKKPKVAQNLNFINGTVENIMGKGENAGNQHFLLFPQCFQKAFLLGSMKVRIVR